MLQRKARCLLLSSTVTMFAAFAFASSPNEQLPAGPAKGKAIAACSTCHEPRIIVQQRLSKAAWTREVDKMIKWGAEVDPGDHDVLIDYFSANFGTDRPAYEAPRMVTGSKPRAQTKPKSNTAEK